MSCGVGHRHGSIPAVLWLWCRLVAAAPVRPLAWEFATGATLKSKKEIRATLPRDILTLLWEKP